MKKKLVKLFMVIAVFSTLMTSCEKDDVEPNDEEVITTMKLTFVPVGGGTSLTYQFRDADGPGGAAPTQQEIVLASNKFYSVTVQLLDETKTPADDISLEVAREADAHRFYYEPTVAAGNMMVGGLNEDTNGVPLGITSTWVTGNVGTGAVRITLRHYSASPPNKAIGDLVNSSKSSTDIEVNFTTRVQ